MEKIDRIFSLPDGSTEQTCKHTMAIRALSRASAKTDLSENHQLSQGPFRMIIGWLHIGIIEKYKKPMVLSAGIGQPISEVLSVFI